MNRRQLEDRISAILDRDDGNSYTTVLARYRLTPNQFHCAVTRKLDECIEFSVGTTRETLEAIEGDVNRQRELFNMEEACIREQYDKFMAGTQGRFHGGSLIHPENINSLVYYALTYHNPQLASSNRKEVIEGIKSLPSNLQDYLHSIGLGGLMQKAFERGKQDSPLAVLEVFDSVYQRKTGDVSLFDLTQDEHVHKWGNNLHATQFYWQNQANVKEAIYHTLTENCPELASTNREEVIEGIKGLPSNLHDYLIGIGLGGLMSEAFEKGKKDSPLAVLEVFDNVYQRKTGDVSLFDLTQDEHVHRWGNNFSAPQSYWQNQANVKEAIYHTLTENCPELASQNREEVVEGIKGLPSNLHDYLIGIGLGGLIQEAFDKEKQGSPLAVLEVFDQVYQGKTGNPSLFDLTQGDYLEVETRNRLVRK